MVIKHNRNIAVMHVSATRMSQNYTFERCKADHLARGFNDIGYHFYITKDGEVHEGRPLTRDGAHVQGHNRGTIGICTEGGLDERGNPADTMNGIQHTAAVGLLQALKKGNPKMKVTGHRDLSPDTNRNGKVDKWEWLKVCPCYDATVKFKFINDD